VDELPMQFCHLPICRPADLPKLLGCCRPVG